MKEDCGVCHPSFPSCSQFRAAWRTMPKVQDLCLTSPGLVFTTRRLEKTNPGLVNSGVWRPPPNGQTDEDERKTIEKSEESEFFCRKYLAEKKNVVLLHSQTGNNDTR